MHTNTQCIEPHDCWYTQCIEPHGVLPTSPTPLCTENDLQWHIYWMVKLEYILKFYRFVIKTF